MNWFTSDWHLGHHNILEYSSRPFSTVEEMNEELVRRFNERVGAEDLCFFLGDMSMNSHVLQHYIPRLNGTKILVPGNHDEVFKKPKREQYYKDVAGFHVVADKLEMTLPLINGTKVLLCHFPYRSADRSERYHEKRPVDKGMFLLHGHTHQKDKKRGRQIHIGIDSNNYYPVNEDEVIELIKS